jgi:hypothetical protein
LPQVRRNVLIVLGLAVLAWGIAALVSGSPGLKLFSASSSTSGASPQCLPSKPMGSAVLAGTHVAASPGPGSVTANPHTAISFLGAPAGQIHDVSVQGARSGSHTGRVSGFSQGDGASFIPAQPFLTGETVTVRASIGEGASSRPVSFSFRVDTPYPTKTITSFQNPPAAPADFQSFYTLHGLQIPIMTVTTPDHDPAAGDIFTTNGPGPGQYGGLIYTPQGQLVWFERFPAGEVAENVSVQSFEGQRVLTMWRGRVLDLGFGVGEDLILNSAYQTIARVRGSNGLRSDLHEFQLAHGDVAYITAYNPIRCDLTQLKGPRDGAIVDAAIQEIDTRTGLVRWEWHSLDHVPASESQVEVPNNPLPWDYFHLNSIDVEPHGEVLISARSTWAGYQLREGAGTILWRLGGTRSSFKMGPGTKMAWQHDGRMLANGELTFFDDGANPPIHSQSRGLRIALDLKTHTATLLRSYTHADPPLLATSQGNMQTLPDDNAVVGYGGIPAISEFARNGSLLFDAHLPFDMTFYRAYRFPWSARPAAPPAVRASFNDTGEQTVVHASWNGATGVAAWRVLAGKSRGALQPRATIASAGFETSVTLPNKYAFVAVQALDAAGHTLATSKTVGVIAFYASLG